MKPESILSLVSKVRSSMPAVRRRIPKFNLNAPTAIPKPAGSSVSWAEAQGGGLVGKPLQTATKPTVSWSEAQSMTPAGGATHVPLQTATKPTVSWSEAQSMTPAGGATHVPPQAAAQAAGAAAQATNTAAGAAPGFTSKLNGFLDRNFRFDPGRGVLYGTGAGLAGGAVGGPLAGLPAAAVGGLYGMLGKGGGTLALGGLGAAGYGALKTFKDKDRDVIDPQTGLPQDRNRLLGGVPNSWLGAAGGALAGYEAGGVGGALMGGVAGGKLLPGLMNKLKDGSSGYTPQGTPTYIQSLINRTA